MNGTLFSLSARMHALQSCANTPNKNTWIIALVVTEGHLALAAIFSSSIASKNLELATQNTKLLQNKTKFAGIGNAHCRSSLYAANLASAPKILYFQVSTP